MRLQSGHQSAMNGCSSIPPCAGCGRCRAERGKSPVTKLLACTALSWELAGWLCFRGGEWWLSLREAEHRRGELRLGAHRGRGELSQDHPLPWRSGCSGLLPHLRHPSRVPNVAAPHVGPRSSQSLEPRWPLTGTGTCFGDHGPQRLPGFDDSFLTRDGWADPGAKGFHPGPYLGKEGLREPRLHCSVSEHPRGGDGGEKAGSPRKASACQGQKSAAWRGL